MKKVVFTFGRLNPPTIGHQKLVDKVESVAKKNGADAKVYLSHTQNNKKDPLDYKSKYKYASAAFGKSVVNSKARTPIDILQELEKQGYTDVIMIVGSDRLSAMGFIKKYNGKEYKFNSIQIMSAGERDPDAEGVEGMSASKMRAAAIEGNFDAFKSGLPPKIQKFAKRIYDELRGIMESDDLNEYVMDIKQRRDRGRLMKKLAKKMQRQKAIRAKKMADTNKLMKRSQKAAKNLLRKKLAGERGENYGTMAPAQKIAIDKLVDKKSALIPKIAKKLLPKVRKAEIARVQAARGQSESMFDWETDPLVIEVFYDLLDTILEEIKVEEKKSFSTFMEGAAMDKAKASADKEKADLADKHAAEMERAAEIDARNAEQEKEREAARAEKEKAESALIAKADKSGLPFEYIAEVYETAELNRDSMNTEQQQRFQAVNSYIANINEMLKREGSKWVLYSKDGSKKLGEFDTKEDALKRERQIQYFKHKNEDNIKPAVKTNTTQYTKTKKFGWVPSSPNDAGKTASGATKPNLSTSPGRTQFNMGEELEEAPRWLGIPIGKAVNKKKYEKAKEILQSVLDRKKKEGKLKHDVVYYASQIAKQFSGVDARALAAMVEEAIPYPMKERGKWTARVKKILSDLDFDTKMGSDEKLAKALKPKIKRLTPDEKEAIYDYFEGEGRDEKRMKSLMGENEEREKKTFKEMMNKATDREWGTDSLTKSYKDDTPGQVDELSSKTLKSYLKKADKDRKKSSDAGKHDRAFKRTMGRMTATGKLIGKKADSIVKRMGEESALDYHNINSLCIKENVYRPHSEMYYQFFREARLEWALGNLEVTDEFDIELLRSDIGEHGIYEGVEVPLDIPMMEEEEKKELNKPKRGGAKKFYVYVKNDKGNIVKVQFGDTSGLDVNFDDKEARKSFAARHNCAQKNDKTKPGYWSCRLPRYAKELGLKNGGSFFW
jgi:hypothetical protein